MLFFTLSTIVAMSFMFLTVTNPLSMGLILLTQTVLVAVSTGCVSHSPWFSYILFLIFLGGMLVLFIYVASIASNEQFSFSFKSLLTAFLTVISIFMIFFFVDPVLIANKIMMFSASILPTEDFFSNAAQVSMLYNTPSYSFTVLIVSYLLLALLIIVKIMNISSKPLRLSY
uniref:NADH-ubiquinone oxidoreductase chain 6 n=1 Tax=Curtonida isos TaxID=814923 RepID=A0A343S8T3_9EUCA|nr:NADH dehydrogenase subunit 6 [Curtonida isos]AUN45058.1 NADH dehydrogenase subunit 6 [Curtonida isos]